MASTLTSTLKNIDLQADAEARQYIKDETVTVVFAQQSGAVVSREGPNRYARGDALITGSTGDSWSVSRARFDVKYLPVPPLTHGQNGAYRSRPLPVLAKQMHQPFAVQRALDSDVIHGNAEDWLLQYAPGDYGIVAAAKFQSVYRRT